MALSVVTTIDNPWNPFTQFKNWLSWDNHNGWQTTQWLAALSFTSSQLSDEQYDKDITDAQDKLVDLNPYGVHVKVYDYEADTLIPIFNQVFKEKQAELAGS